MLSISSLLSEEALPVFSGPLPAFSGPLPSFSGEFLVIGNQASKSFKLKRDVLTEGDEIFKLKLVDYPEVFVEVEIVDSSNTLFD